MKDFERILFFLNELNLHNSKEWMDANKNRYQESRLGFISKIEEVIEGLSKLDPMIEGLKAKECIFRINRDVRFSNNKSPYKTNFGAAISSGGRHSGNPVYYLHIEPGKSFTAGGVYMPEASALAKIRQEVDYHPNELIEILNKPSFKNKFSGLEGEKLKTAPKGYPKDHPQIELLKHKSFIVTKPITDQELKNSEIIKTILEDFQEIFSLNQFLLRALH